MQTHSLRFGWPELVISFGACLFIFVLALSAYFEPDIRWLHFFQAWMYMATIALSLRRNRWGYLIGISAAGFWDYINLFVTTFFRNGMHWLAASVTTGNLQHVDQIIAVPAWIGNFLVVVGCIWGFARLSNQSRWDLLRLAVAFALTTAFFAADVAVFQPRYLPLFRRALHPRFISLYFSHHDSTLRFAETSEPEAAHLRLPISGTLISTDRRTITPGTLESEPQVAAVVTANRFVNAASRSR